MEKKEALPGLDNKHFEKLCNDLVLTAMANYLTESILHYYYDELVYADIQEMIIDRTPDKVFTQYRQGSVALVKKFLTSMSYIDEQNNALAIFNKIIHGELITVDEAHLLWLASTQYPINPGRREELDKYKLIDKDKEIKVTKGDVDLF